MFSVIVRPVGCYYAALAGTCHFSFPAGSLKENSGVYSHFESFLQKEGFWWNVWFTLGNNSDGACSSSDLLQRDESQSKLIDLPSCMARSTILSLGFSKHICQAMASNLGALLEQHVPPYSRSLAGQGCPEDSIRAWPCAYSLVLVWPWPSFLHIDPWPCTWSVWITRLDGIPDCFAVPSSLCSAAALSLISWLFNLACPLSPFSVWT